MNAEQVMVKFFVEDASRLDLAELIPVFHDWIRNHKLDEMLIDVADYRHVAQGPGVLLVCHGAIYAMDQADGRTGLEYRRRHVNGREPESVDAAFRRALAACTLLEQEPSLKGRVRFLTGEAQFRIADRLQAPNTAETFASVKPEIERTLAKLYAGAPVTITHRAGARDLFTVDVRASAPAEIAVLHGRLGA
jgi:hypothetical protein